MKTEKICVRCGMSEKEVRHSGAKCSVWGKGYRNHKYIEVEQITQDVLRHSKIVNV